MKFGHNLAHVIEFSDPEWGPYWMNYKQLKKKIREIVNEKGGSKLTHPEDSANPFILRKSCAEVEFFRLLKSELKKTDEFFKAEEELFRIRQARVSDGFHLMKDNSEVSDKASWTRLSKACIKFYEDVLLLENFAIMNYCGFSKILKKHDKLTGFSTREAFMRNTMENQSFTHHYSVIQMLKESEKLFLNIQNMKSAIPLKDEERLFIEAIRDLNYQASRVQAEEKFTMQTEGDEDKTASEDECPSKLTIASRLFPHANKSAEGNTSQPVVDHDALSTTSEHNSVEHDTCQDGYEQSAADGLYAATEALTTVSKKTYLCQSLPNLSSAISWIYKLNVESRSASMDDDINEENSSDNNDGEDVDKKVQHEQVSLPRHVVETDGRRRRAQSAMSADTAESIGLKRRRMSNMKSRK
mmetsp:Transcript_28378/g.28676  ORF Transcript_28378/g.28676 Transcript_28378/m.28676 type:complete len:413 (-) Transcript_28378:230-1468(-)|eukprot:CAMPEP_0182429054 /NCGR_PEP_ID=MMETSP1167-20130531/25479_1 /TAXON_ID=2988 /ORGANISM="Mallomonas Sp, Strain CCMP3275" /LENGTH=412 /DNA_ID=CAMNT_0024612361 /DNA_START=84 /DNA_END=1322 /DNA_ORIENTATION=-